MREKHDFELRRYHPHVVVVDGNSDYHRPFFAWFSVAGILWITVFAGGYFYAKLSYDFPFRRRGFIYFPTFMMIFDNLNARVTSYTNRKYT